MIDHPLIERCAAEGKPMIISSGMANKLEVGEAIEAGCWGVGIARYSNYMDIDSFGQVENLPENDVQRRLATTRETLETALIT